MNLRAACAEPGAVQPKGHLSFSGHLARAKPRQVPAARFLDFLGADARAAMPCRQGSGIRNREPRRGGGRHRLLHGVLVMDETDKREDRRFVARMEGYFTTTWIVPTPFFVSSDMAYAVQAADLCIYCVNWGFRLPIRGEPTDEPERPVGTTIPSCQIVVKPPSTSRLWPVTYADARPRPGTRPLP